MRRVNGYVLFWSGWPSNWHPSSFRIGTETFNCVEQYLMARKASLFRDFRTRDMIMSATDPSDQKRYGRQVVGYVDAEWARIRYSVCLTGTLEKYRQNPDLRELLFATGDDVFVEASPEDRIWGIGLRPNDPRAADPKNWRGTNLLGEAITETKGLLRTEYQR